MKIVRWSDDSTTLYINNLNLNQLDFLDKENLEEYFQKLFLKLKNKYNILLNGYYVIDVYKDKYYGIVIEINKDDLEYFDYTDQVDMEISIHDSQFVFKIFDIIKNDKLKYYAYNNDIYAILTESIDSIKYGEILEFSELIYKNEVNKIIKYGKLIKS
ncbi:MAG: hypothetical protein ACK5HP_01220 [Bacilli bacterium]